MADGCLYRQVAAWRCRPARWENDEPPAVGDGRSGVGRSRPAERPDVLLAFPAVRLYRFPKR